MKTIYKYELANKGQANVEVQLLLPIGALVVDAQIQRILIEGTENQFKDIIVLWAIVDPKEEEFETRKFIIAWTGMELPTNYVHISTFQDTAQRMVYHIIEKL
jgi:hypothetical protein